MRSRKFVIFANVVSAVAGRGPTTASSATNNCGPNKSALAPIEDALAGVARFHQLDRVAKFSKGKAVGDDRRDVEATLDHRGHFVPGFVHLAAVNSFDGQA